MRGLILRRRSLWILTLQCAAAFLLLNLHHLHEFAEGTLALTGLLAALRGGILGLLIVPWFLTALFEDKGRFLVEEGYNSLLFYVIVSLLSFVGLFADRSFFGFFFCFLLAAHAALATIRYVDNLDIILRLEEDERDDMYLGVTLPHVVAALACVLTPVMEIGPTTETAWKLAVVQIGDLGLFVTVMWFLALALYVAIELAVLVRLGTAAGATTEGIESITAVEDVAWQRSRLRGPTSDIASRLVQLDTGRAPSREEITEVVRELARTRDERRLAYMRTRFGSQKVARQEVRLSRQLMAEALLIPSRVPCIVLALAGLETGLNDMSKLLNAATGRNYYQFFSRFRERLVDESGALHWFRDDLFSELSEGKVVVADGARPLSRLLLLRLAREAAEADELGDAIENFRADMGVILDDVRKG